MEKESTFLVTHADADSAVLKDVDDGQVHTLSANPGVEEGDVVVGSVAPEPPMEVTYSLVGVDERRSVAVERSEEPPTRRARETAADQAEGELTRIERAGDGELHVLTVPPGTVEDAAEDVLSAEETRTRAARLGARRVEVRTDDGVVSVRYLP